MRAVIKIYFTENRIDKSLIIIVLLAQLNPQSRKIITGSCTCRYGVLGECKHSAAVVHYVNKHEVAACTSLPQAWGKPSKKPKLDDKASIADLFGGRTTTTSCSVNVASTPARDKSVEPYKLSRKSTPHS